MASHHNQIPLDVILTDEGWSAELGNWYLPHPGKFSHGMKWLAGEIAQRGLTNRRAVGKIYIPYFHIGKPIVKTVFLSFTAILMSPWCKLTIFFAKNKPMPVFSV